MSAKVWRMPVEGGTPAKVLEGVRGRQFTVTQHGIYFAAGLPDAELRFFDFASKSVRPIAPLSDWPYAAISSDELWALYSRYVFVGANLGVVENFR